MSYTLWSHGRLLGHTELDVPHVQDFLRHGFIEPTPLGEDLLPDATGVFRFCLSTPRSRRDDAYFEAFARAVEAREAQELMLRDENGAVFDCDFIRVYPTADVSCNDQDYDDWQSLSASDADSFDDEEEEDFDIDAEIEEDEAFSDGGCEPEDIRWTTMSYFIQVFLKRCDEPFATLRALGDDATGSPA